MPSTSNSSCQASFENPLGMSMLVDRPHGSLLADPALLDDGEEWSEDHVPPASLDPPVAWVPPPLAVPPSAFEPPTVFGVPPAALVPPYALAPALFAVPPVALYPPAALAPPVVKIPPVANAEPPIDWKPPNT